MILSYNKIVALDWSEIYKIHLTLKKVVNK